MQKGADSQSHPSALRCRVGVFENYNSFLILRKAVLGSFFAWSHTIIKSIKSGSSKIISVEYAHSGSEIISKYIVFVLSSNIGQLSKRTSPINNALIVVSFFM